MLKIALHIKTCKYRPVKTSKPWVQVGKFGEGDELGLGGDGAVLARDGGDLCAHLHHGGSQVLSSSVLKL